MTESETLDVEIWLVTSDVATTLNMRSVREFESDRLDSTS